MVQLIDLWVASMLPGMLLDHTFEIVTTAAGPEATTSAPLDALHFARGLVALATRELWWDDPADTPLNGRRVESIVARAQAEPSLDVTAPRSQVRRAISMPDLRRLLPHTARAYPFVEWRSVPCDPRRRQAG